MNGYLSFKLHGYKRGFLYLLLGFGFFETRVGYDLHGDLSTLDSRVLPVENLPHLVALGKAALK